MFSHFVSTSAITYFNIYIKIIRAKLFNGEDIFSHFVSTFT